jgi:anti-anti-sigma regulatory factor
MEIKIDKVQNLDVIKLSGPVGFKDNIKVRELFKMISRKNLPALIVNLEGTENIPHMLVGTFALFHQTYARGKKKKLVFCGIGEELIEGFMRHKLSGSLPYAKSEEEALKQIKAA